MATLQYISEDSLSFQDEEDIASSCDTSEELLSFASSSAESQFSSTQPLHDAGKSSGRIDLSKVEHGVNIYPVLYDVSSCTRYTPVVPDNIISEGEEDEESLSIDTDEGEVMQAIQDDINNNTDKEQDRDDHAQEPLVHRTEPGDTLAGLSLRYGVSIAELKKANDIIATGESDVLAVEEVVVPTHKDGNTDGNEEKSAAEARWEQRRKKQMERMAVVLFARSKNIPEEEARYYLLLHDYDCQAASREYAADCAWEARREAVRAAKKRRRLLRELHRYGCCVPLLVRTVGGGEEDTVLGYDGEDMSSGSEEDMPYDNDDDNDMEMSTLYDGPPFASAEEVPRVTTAAACQN